MHRKLEGVGAIDQVVQSPDRDELGKGWGKTDLLDAQELCRHLDRYMK